MGRGVAAPPHVEWEGRREGEGERGQGGGGDGDGGQEGGGDGGDGQKESENVVDRGWKVFMRNKGEKMETPVNGHLRNTNEKDTLKMLAFSL